MTEAEAMEKFKDLCVKDFYETDPEKKLDPSEEQDWFSLSLGFFVALGFPYLAAWQMATDARYKHEYWTPVR